MGVDNDQVDLTGRPAEVEGEPQAADLEAAGNGGRAIDPRQRQPIQHD